MTTKEILQSSLGELARASLDVEPDLNYSTPDNSLTLLEFINKQGWTIGALTCAYANLLVSITAIDREGRLAEWRKGWRKGN